MKYKVNDRVRIKSLDWYNENKDEFGVVLIENGEYLFFESDTIWCGKVVTIADVCLDEYYTIVEDFGLHRWTDGMIEGLVEEEIYTVLNIYKDGYIHGGNVVGNEITLPQGYQFVDENGNVINATKVILEKKKKEYPKTYEECCKILGIDACDLDILDNMLDTPEMVYRKNLDRLLNSFRKLLICRDAYWKIAGEEMGLGKPWEPDDSSGYCTYAILRHTGHIRKSRPYADSELLEFPTEEMRDAFYENFKSEIESCKGLL